MGTSESGPGAPGDERTRRMEEEEAASRDRESRVAADLGMGDAAKKAEAEVGPREGEASSFFPESAIGRLDRVAHDVRVDVRMLEDVGHRLDESSTPERAAALEAVDSQSIPHLVREPGGQLHRTVAFSAPCHIDAAGARFAYRAGGQGPVLLLIAGHAATMAAWDPAFLGALALGGRRVTLFDNRGMGMSETPPDVDITIASMADDAVAVLDALGVGSADVLGWSTGGFVAQELALRHPDRVERLVLAATSPGGGAGVAPAPEVRAVLDDPRPSDEDLVRIYFPATDDGRAAADGWTERVKEQPGAREEWFRRPPEIVAAQAAAERDGWLGSGSGAADRLGQIAASTLVLDGTEDVVIPPEASRALAEGISDAVLRLYEGAGHGVLFHDPGRVADDITAFLHGRPLG